MKHDLGNLKFGLALGLQLDESGSDHELGYLDPMHYECERPPGESLETLQRWNLGHRKAQVEDPMTLCLTMEAPGRTPKEELPRPKNVIK